MDEKTQVGSYWKEIFTGVLIAVVTIYIIDPSGNWFSRKINDLLFKKQTWVISHNGILGIELGESLSAAKKTIIDNDLVYEYEDPGFETDNIPCLIIMNKRDSILFILEDKGRNGVVSGIIVISPDFRTVNGIHPEMVIEDFVEDYESSCLHNSITSELYGSEYFSPYDFQTDSTVFKLVTTYFQDDLVGTYDNSLDNFGYHQRSCDFDMQRRISIVCIEFDH